MASRGSWAHEVASHGARRADSAPFDAFLRGSTYQPAAKHEIVGKDMLNVWYYTDAEQRDQSNIEVTNFSY